MTQPETFSKNADKPQGPLLHATPVAALQQMIRITQTLITLSDRETQALVQRDMASFSILQDEKERTAQDYKQASEEFRARLREFRGVEKSLLERLQTMQNTLAEKAQSNNQMVDAMRKRSRQNTQQTLLAVQEIAQSRFVRFKDGAAAAAAE